MILLKRRVLTLQKLKLQNNHHLMRTTVSRKKRNHHLVRITKHHLQNHHQAKVLKHVRVRIQMKIINQVQSRHPMTMNNHKLIQTLVKMVRLIENQTLIHTANNQALKQL
ncbi:hypothetical protein CD133_01520 [Staphylococcus massiliensis CCUG 55927]|nr:hypothetical protein CD133_01520 [Staphylococcus massiliensis CCUG 55927]